MISLPEIPEAVQWAEGMPLAPQHFQEAALRAEMLLGYHLAAAAPFPWGIERLEVDPVHLVHGTFRVQVLDAVMPDGLAVRHGPDHGVLELALGPRLGPTARVPVTVYLGLPRRRTGDQVGGELARFDSVHGRQVADSNTGNSPVAVGRLRPRLTLLFDEHPGYVTLPLARVAYQGEAYRLGHGAEAPLEEVTFVPPGLTVAPGSELGRLCQDLARRLREKAALLADRVQAGARTARRPELIETQLQVRSLIGALPPLEILVQGGRAHPAAVYLALSAVVGQLAGATPGLVPPVLPPYRPNDPWSSFAFAGRYIRRALDAIAELYQPIAFHLDAGGFRLPLEPAWLRDELIVGVTVARNDAEAAAWMEASLIGSEQAILAIHHNRTLGLRRTRIEEVRSLHLTPRQGEALYRIGVESDLLAATDVLRIAPSPDRRDAPMPVEVVLYLPNPASDAGD
ncbi:MAG: type VI secretion system baseplate subunit TssK [Gemmatimonadales bacterium]|nr:type VI secretion system baseplate subunit TssK [Gemmatimonadales bacterium]